MDWLWKREARICVENNKVVRIEGVAPINVEEEENGTFVISFEGIVSGVDAFSVLSSVSLVLTGGPQTIPLTTVLVPSANASILGGLVVLDQPGTYDLAYSVQVQTDGFEGSQSARLTTLIESDQAGPFLPVEGTVCMTTIMQAPSDLLGVHTSKTLTVRFLSPVTLRLIINRGPGTTSAVTVAGECTFRSLRLA